MLRNNADARRCSYFELGLPVITRSKFDWFFSAHAVKMVSSDVRITGALARQTGLRAVQIETNGFASVGFC